MKHVTRYSKKLSINSKTLPKSSLKKGYSTDLENNPFEVEIKSEFDCFLETKLQDYQRIKMSNNAEVEEIDGSSSYKDYKHDFKFKNPRFSIDLKWSAPVEEHLEFIMEIRDENDRVKELKATIRPPKHIKRRKKQRKSWIFTPTMNFIVPNDEPEDNKGIHIRESRKKKKDKNRI
jgi:hypothetical protein